MGRPHLESGGAVHRTETSMHGWPGWVHRQRREKGWRPVWCLAVARYVRLSCIDVGVDCLSQSICGPRAVSLRHAGSSKAAGVDVASANQIASRSRAHCVSLLRERKGGARHGWQRLAVGGGWWRRLCVDRVCGSNGSRVRR